MAANKKMESWSGDRDKFLGSYRWENNPLGVEKGHCGNDTIECGHPCAAGHVKVLLSANKKEE